MFSRIDSAALRTPRRERLGEAFLAGHCAPLRRAAFVVGFFAALFASAACSGHGDELLVTVEHSDSAPKPLDAGPQCVPLSFLAPDVGLDLYFVLDHSEWSFGQQDQDWVTIVGWLTNLSFPARDPIFDAGQSVPDFGEIGVGFGIYPATEPRPQSCVDTCATASDCDDCLDGCGCEIADFNDRTGICECILWPPSCNENDYSPALEITRLNDGQWARTLFTVPQLPVRERTLGPALVASLDYRRRWEEAHPGRRVTQVLVIRDLDLANECPNDRISDIERLLSSADNLKTYVVAVNGPDPNSSNNSYRRLAVAGRTTSEKSFSTHVSQASPNPFIELVDTIRREEGRCEYRLPAEPDLDSKKVNLTASSGGFAFPYVASSAECERTNEGWYYDNTAQPTRILACPGACEKLHLGAKIQIGCPTVRATDAGR
jgi:hypothetical protein